ncbi:hypothetical protein J437_LFUL010564 [Ladona fulva]|uniref:Transposase n=1 Tax=Ladona fulva TaxID=123851 RepID=A0A8K0KFL3_LADFU|nr:hypothetical protein J437_LFUL010564 [Ladona fulva]
MRVMKIPVSFVSDHVEEKMEELRISLPHHVMCASHTLNLLATTDAIKKIAKSLSRMHHIALGKCTFLWNASRRPHSAKKMKLSYPGVTRWNSLYDALGQVLKHNEKLQAVFSALGTKIQIEEAELEYLREYLDIMRLIATSIDWLQGDGCYFGLLLLILFVIKGKPDEMESKVLRRCAPLVTGLKVSLENRFNKYFSLSAEVNDAIWLLVHTLSLK